jgi:L-methionine (R)-S-oxide reductase
MPESLKINENSNKEQKYNELLPQIASLIQSEPNLYANLANISAALKEVFKFWWVGFYLVDGDDQLVLGPFQVHKTK